ncbi:MAG: bifunctional phosphopantothenoylcysteine decarboxylase/phosphopantothenate--cysteine ligase CoaBC [Candidatus Atabeyarchaeum deiterrae]
MKSWEVNRNMSSWSSPFQDHSSKVIKGATSSVLSGKKIVLCITGSVAAVECPIIARELMRHGAEVYAVMSPAACSIIHPNLMEWATGNRVITHLTGQVEHVSLGGDSPGHADLILVAPTTANTIGKVASGIDDTPVTTVVSTAFGSGMPILMVPAMHETLYRHPIVLENIEKLKSHGVVFLGPRMEEGKAKIARTDSIVNKVIDVLTKPKDMAGLHVLITAGPTREYIDRVRFISNPSSGKMGVAIAQEAAARGAKVTLVYGIGMTSEPPIDLKCIPVVTTEDMMNAVLNEMKLCHCHIFVGTAAVSDYAPTQKVDGKIPSGQKDLSIHLKPLPRIVKAVKEESDETYVVGFKAEYNVSESELIERAYSRVQEIGLDLIVANDVSKEGVGFSTDTNEVYIVDPQKRVTHVSLSSKRDVASRIFDITMDHYNGKRGIIKEKAKTKEKA